MQLTTATPSEMFQFIAGILVGMLIVYIFIHRHDFFQSDKEMDEEIRKEVKANGYPEEHHLCAWKDK